MDTEFEVKILDIDVEQIKKKLADLGAEKLAEKNMRRYVYDLLYDDESKDCTRWIRLRDTSEKITVTLKEVKHDEIGGTKEIEVVVNDFEKANELLNELGFFHKAYQENNRISYKLGDVKIEIDFWPMIPPYIEVEGKNKEDVEKVVKLLGFTMEQTTGLGVGKVFKHYGIEIHDFKELKFETKAKNLIHKTCAVVVKDNKILLVRKKGKDIWTGLGGRVEEGETEEECLLREIKEEVNTDARIIKKMGDFEDEPVFDPGSWLKLSTFLVELEGEPELIDPELEEFKFIGKEHEEKLSNLVDSQIFPWLVKENLIDW